MHLRAGEKRRGRVPQRGLRQRCSYVWKWTLPTGEARTTLLWRAIALVSVWIVTAAALRHYASFAYERSLLDETAMITVLAASMVTLLAILELFTGPELRLPRTPIFWQWSGAGLCSCESPCFVR